MKVKDILTDKYSYRIYNAILLFAAFAATLTLTVNGSYIKHGYDISVNTISDRDFFAPSDIINNIATQRLKDNARSSVPDIYNHDSSIDTAVLAEINNFFTLIESNDYDESFTDAATPLGITENIFLTRSQYYCIEDLSYQQYADFKDNVLSIARNTLEQGIREDTVETMLTSVRDSVDALGYDRKEGDAAFAVLSASLKPNLIVDTQATDKAKEEKAAEIDDVVVLANQKIVGEGEIITDEIYALLDQAGFLKKEGFKENISQISGVFILLLCTFSFICAYMFFIHKRLYKDKRSMVLLFAMYIIVITITHFMSELPYMLVPILPFTMLTAIILGTSEAFFLNLFVTLASMFIYRGDISFVLYFWLCGSIISVTLQLAEERNKILLCGAVNSVIFSAIMAALQMFFNTYWRDYILSYTAYAFLSGIISIIVCIGSMPLLESAFGIVTDYRLQDLTSSNQKLMRRLMIEAPGTYHHSLIVANLSEAAAYAVGANPNIARAGACYHDIGKLSRPMYFSENMQGGNIHDRLNPYDSAKIIMQHIFDGVELAKKYRLPAVIVNIIKEHHGTSIVRFFYYKQTKLSEENPSITKPDEADFRYKSTLPSTKEAAIIMLADTVEAAVRSSMSKGMTEKEIADFIKKLIKEKLNDGQLNNCDLTIRDLDKIKDAFLEIFKGMYHERVAYPQLNDKE